MPTPNVKSSQAASGRWSRRASSAGPEYTAGVEGTQADWAALAAAGAAAYIQGVQEAQGRGAFSKGVQQAGTAKWKSAALKKGPGRFAEGVMVGTEDYARGVEPYLEIARRTDLPMRGPVGSEQNFNRSTTMAKAFRAAKVRK